MNIQLLGCKVSQRAEPTYRSGKSYSQLNRERKSYNSKPKIYVHPEGESIMDQLFERRNRPIQLFRKLAVQAALKALNLPADTKVTWSQYAGCTSCPCSPGFIVQTNAPIRANVWCTVGDPVEAAKRKEAMVEKDREYLVARFAD